MTDAQKSRLAIQLIDRFQPAIPKIAAEIANSNSRFDGKTAEQSRLEQAMSVLDKMSEIIADSAPPDANWYRDLFIITGEHMVLTEYGWVPAESNTREACGDEPMEVLDEVNAPAGV